MARLGWRHPMAVASLTSGKTSARTTCKAPATACPKRSGAGAESFASLFRLVGANAPSTFELPCKSSTRTPSRAGGAWVKGELRDDARPSNFGARLLVDDLRPALSLLSKM